MAFKGDLTNISLFDVFQTLSQNQQNGVLVLSRDGSTKKIHISPEGVRIFFTRSFRPLRLGEIFVRRGRITPQDVEILLLAQKRCYRPFGELLVESGKVGQEEVDAILRYHAEDEIFEVFGWEAGSFSFYDGQDVGDPTTPLSAILMDPAALCLEAARRLDEMERLRAALPENDEYYLQAEGEEADLQECGSSACALFDALAEPNSIDDLRDLVGLSLFDVLTGIQRLRERGLIRPLVLDELLDHAHHARDMGEFDRAARMLEKAHELAPEDRSILEDCVDAIERVGDSRRLAKFLAQLGVICLENDEVDEAIEYLEQTLRSDATHLGALMALREAFVRQGDAERVAEMSVKIARIHADKARLAEALEACAVGLEHAPNAIALRFHYAQLLARTEHLTEAKDQIWSLVHETERSGKAARNDKAHELLSSCYRLLLKVDPTDQEAESGLRDLDRRRMSSLRRRKLAVRGGAAVAVLLIVLGVGVTVGGTSADSLRDEIEKAQAQRPNSQQVLDLIDELVTTHPDSPETQWALALRHQIDDAMSAETQARKKQEDAVRKEMTRHLEEVRESLNDRAYGEALSPVKSFLQKLDQPQVNFLRKTLSPTIEYELSSFIERLQKAYDADRQQVAVGQVQIKQLEGNAEGLREFEDKLGRVRQRDWLHVLPDLSANLAAICDSPHVGKAADAYRDFAKRVEGTQAIFESLDALFFTARKERLRAEIMDLYKVATSEGKDYLRDCEFEKAREIYDAAYQKALSIQVEEPRQYFLDLLSWLDLRGITVQMRAQCDKIDHVVATLREVEKLREAKAPDKAFRLMRALVSDQRLIQFERKYKLPYLLTSVPEGAEVTVNGTSAGKTPCEIQLEIVQRPVMIRLTRPGFEEAEAQIVPTDPALDGSLRVPLPKDLAWDKESASGGVEAQPTIAKGLALLATTDAALVAYRLDSGERQWDAPTGLLHRITASPVVAGDAAYLVTVDGFLHRVLMKNGSIRKIAELGAQVDRDPAVHDSVAYIATRKPSLVAVQGTQVLWEKPLRHSPTTRVLYLDGQLYVGTAKGSVLVHDAVTGEETREMRVTSGTSFWGGLAIHGHLVLAGAEDGKLYAFDTRKGALAWDFPTSGPVAAPAASDGTYIYLPTRDGYVYILSDDGKKVGALDVGYAMKRAPTLADGFLYVIGGNHVKAYELSSRKLWWDRTFTDEYPIHITSGGDHIVVVTDKPWIYVFSADSR